MSFAHEEGIEGGDEGEASETYDADDSGDGGSEPSDGSSEEASGGDDDDDDDPPPLPASAERSNWQRAILHLYALICVGLGGVTINGETLLAFAADDARWAQGAEPSLPRGHLLYHLVDVLSTMPTAQLAEMFRTFSQPAWRAALATPFMKAGAMHTPRCEDFLGPLGDGVPAGYIPRPAALAEAAAASAVVVAAATARARALAAAAAARA